MATTNKKKPETEKSSTLAESATSTKTTEQAELSRKTEETKRKVINVSTNEVEDPARKEDKISKYSYRVSCPYCKGILFTPLHKLEYNRTLKETVMFLRRGQKVSPTKTQSEYYFCAGCQRTVSVVDITQDFFDSETD